MMKFRLTGAGRKTILSQFFKLNFSIPTIEDCAKTTYFKKSNGLCFIGIQCIHRHCSCTHLALWQVYLPMVPIVDIGRGHLLLHFRFWHFQEWHFQKCNFQIFSEMTFETILTLLEIFFYFDTFKNDTFESVWVDAHSQGLSSFLANLTWKAD